MTRYKLRRIDFWIYLIIAFILGILAVFCFSPPEASIGRDTSDLLDKARALSDSWPDYSKEGQVSVSGTQPAPTFTVTAYCGGSCCCYPFADGITASGHIIEPNDCFVAAPPEYPFGTRLSIPGYAGGRIVAVEDRGGKIKGNKIDVFFDTHQEALVWGVREFEIK